MHRLLIVLQLPFTHTPATTMVTGVRVSGEQCHITLVSNILHTVHHHPHHTIWHPCSSAAFFVTLQFSDQVPYVAILKIFHIKNKLSQEHRI